MIVLFHHAQGLTDGVLSFAETLREAGHTVHTPDSYDGHTFDDIEEGVGFARETGFQVVADRALAAAEALPAAAVYGGFSLGVPPAQRLAQSRQGVRGLLSLHGAIPPAEFGAWPDGLAAQVHAMTDDPWFEDFDRAAAKELEALGADYFLYPGSAHLFADSSLSSYDAEAAALLTERVLEFLARTDS
ncbi:dienelactone hydrolase [Nocardioides sp. JQ2195]|uniref:dienelactone hydrolase family protein n=1 Tax=Nocardioides sp. JQ2195 TaxID=2592334 RepID=UPI00143E1A65|nr:dienelactone hydrolase family protein [Nocardioides sp. JQ2195]QIX28402.1 dienelactone hydrolase [Nocardioides sp. JQ2195]